MAQVIMEKGTQAIQEGKRKRKRLKDLIYTLENIPLIDLKGFQEQKKTWKKLHQLYRKNEASVK